MYYNLDRDTAYGLLDDYIKKDIDKLKKELGIFSKHQDNYYAPIKRNEIRILITLRQYLSENLK